jgi:maltooligosyltrehalose trehalohydrolase
LDAFSRMKSVHKMPFGAECLDGATRFRLWAPSQERVTLELGRENRRKLEMRALEGGWHELVVQGTGHGTAYGFSCNLVSPAKAGAQVFFPDPASRVNPWDVNGPSVVVDPRRYEWEDAQWKGRPWHEAVVYELHVGTFTPEGTFRAVIPKLDHLVKTGITAIELMPVADFAGKRGWGYDGVLPFAPDSAYGFPEDLKALVEAAHERGLMVLLDVVYNHFGPEGNYLHAYAKDFFNEAHQTPWGAAINFDGPNSRTVRDFFIHNALYWIDEYRFDGLRLDAVHAIRDDSPTHIVEEIAQALEEPARERHVHLVLENDANSARLLESRHPGEGRGPISRAQWNDDAHHAFHVLLTGEGDGYYGDYIPDAAHHLGRTLAEGFAWQGEPSPHRKGERRGEPSAHLPLTAFMPFLQNHDQIGNRAMGDRLTTTVPPERLRLAMAMLLLSPSVPLVFMGEEFGATTPFLYFCDFQGELADAVRDGRRKEFASFEKFSLSPGRGPGRGSEAIPDPNDPKTFVSSQLDWASVLRKEHAASLEHFRALTHLRTLHIVPRLAKGPVHGKFVSSKPGYVAVDWAMGDGSRLWLRANLADTSNECWVPNARLLHVEGVAPAANVAAATSAPGAASGARQTKVAPWSAAWWIA